MRSSTHPRGVQFKRSDIRSKKGMQMATDMELQGAKQTREHGATYAVLACVAGLLVLTGLGSMLNVGDHLFGVHPVLGWVFWALIVLLVILGVVVPLVQVARRPIFSLYELRDQHGHMRKRYCQMLVNNLVSNANLTDEEVKQVEAALDQGSKADDVLIRFFKERIVPGIDAATKRTATSAFLVAAISRSPLISTVTMLSLCLDLVRDTVELCGFRPTNIGLARLYVRVVISALIVGGIEDADLSEMLSQALGGGAGAHMGGLVIGAAAEGLVSAFLVFRVGIITKRWLTSEDGPARLRQIRRTSYREALTLMGESGFVPEMIDKLRTIMGTAASSAANTVATAAVSTATSAANTVVSTASSAANTVAAAVGDAAYPTTNAAGAAAVGARESAEHMAGRLRGIFHR